MAAGGGCSCSGPGNWSGCVWDVAFLDNQDLVTACADHTARIWTARAEAAAAPEVMQQYEARLMAHQQDAQAGTPLSLPALKITSLGHKK